MSIATETTDSRNSDLPSDPDLGSLTDADLLDAWCRDRHSAALAAIIHRYSVMVLSVCRRRCRSEADADDAFQTTFLYLARNSKKIRHPDRLPGWLQRVAQRAAVATLKAKKHGTEPMVDTPANPDDPLDRLTQRHEAIVLDEELADLPEHYRAALVMHIFDDQPLARMADHFGTTIGSIRGRLQRGKQLLARRLRRRGVVPVLALAAAGRWTVSKPAAAEASQSLIDATVGGELPHPPIEPSLLEPLLNQGASVMSSLYTATSLVAATALLALLLTTTPGAGGEDAPVSLPAAADSLVAAQFSAPAGGVEAAANNGAAQQAQQDTAGMGGMFVQPAKQWITRPVMPQPISAVAKTALEALDKEFDFELSGFDVEPGGLLFDELPQQLAAIVGVPVLLNDRGVAFAQVEPGSQLSPLSETQMPLRTALRRILNPLGLKAVVEDEGIVITADPAALVHRGIGTSRWINIDNEAEENISATLGETITFEFVDTPLTEVIDSITAEHSISTVLDQRSLEDIGMALDTPVNFHAKGIKLRNALELILQPLDLTYTIQGESLLITSVDNNDRRILNRIYWLEGTGFAVGDYDSIIEMITSTIEPELWEDVGGPSMISPLPFSRPALMVATTYATHQSIEQLFDSLRKSHFGNDPVLERIELPAGVPVGGGMGAGGSGAQGGGGGFF